MKVSSNVIYCVLYRLPIKYQPKNLRFYFIGRYFFDSNTGMNRVPYSHTWRGERNNKNRDITYKARRQKEQKIGGENQTMNLTSYFSIRFLNTGERRHCRSVDEGGPAAP